MCHELSADDLEGLIFDLDLPQAPTVILASTVSELTDLPFRCHLYERLLDSEISGADLRHLPALPGSAFHVSGGLAWRTALLARASLLLGRGRPESPERTQAMVGASLLGGLDLPRLGQTLDGIPGEAEAMADLYRPNGPPIYAQSVPGGVVDFVDNGLLFLIPDEASLSDVPLWANPKTPFKEAWDYLQYVANDGGPTIFGSIAGIFR